MFTALIKKPVRIFSCLFITLLLISFFYTSNIVKASGSCTASVSPSSVQTSTTTGFVFIITNTGSSAINYIELNSPSSNLTLDNRGVPGWSVSANNSLAELSGGTIAAGSQFQFTFYAISGSTEAPSANWGVSTSDGSGIVSCTGSLGTAISGVRDVTPPDIIDLKVSDIASTSVKISWTTDEAASATLDYGVDDYTSHVSDANQTTAHSFSLTGLTGGTLYIFQVSSKDVAGNERYSFDNSFTTASVVPTSTPTSTTVSTSATATPVPTVFVTPTPTPPPADRVSPRVSLTTEPEKSYKLAPLIEGTASDNEQVSKVEYSTDGGANWLPVDDADGLGTEKVDFSFTPYIFEDGNYDVVARATDGNSNTAKSDTLVIVIDVLPPRIGGNYMAFGPQPLLPNKDGVIVTMVGIEQKITLSAVGGPVKITLDTGEGAVDLVQSVETGLWSGLLLYKNPGLYTIKSTAVDGAGNEVKKDLNKILVINPGYIKNETTKKIIGKGTIEVFVKDSVSGIWARWDGATFGQDNPQKITSDGYEYFLPAGTYYIEITSPGYATQISKIFTLSVSTILNSDFYMGEKKGINFGFFKLSLPSFLVNKVPVILKIQNAPGTKNNILGEAIGDMELDTIKGNKFDTYNLRGKKWALTFISTWVPTAFEQLSLLDKDIGDKNLDDVIISGMESVPRVSIFSRRGSYLSDIVVDTYGELFDKLEINTIPTHVFINKQGIIERTATGVLLPDEITSILDEIK